MTKIRSTDKSRIQDRRGQSSGGGGGMSFPFPGMGGSGGSGGGAGFPFPGGGKGAGGLLGIIVLLAAVFLPKLLGSGAGQQFSETAPASASSEQCETELEKILCGANESVQDYWATALPQFFTTEYQSTNMVWFTGGVDTACGQASSQVGPFYCPGDNMIYIDMDFMQQLENQLVGTTSDLAEQYIIAHEYGHHIQNLLGTNAQVQSAQQNRPDLANQYSVALELQADCYAGAWVGANDVLESDAELQEAIAAAEGVGDDRIQEKMQGRIDPESWTHGSAEQRRTWFLQGYNSQDPRTCDGTFSEIG